MARRRKMLGEVNLLGLNAFGSPVGMNPIFGTLIGGGTAAVSTIAARHAGLKQPELIGLGVGVAASGVMFAMKSTRHAAIGGLIGAFLASGIAFLEKKLLGAATVPVSPGEQQAVEGIGFPQLRALNGLGLHQARALNGLGLHTMAPTASSHGAIPGVAGSHLAAAGGGGPPVSLLGTPSAASLQLLGAGGPQTHGISAAYGATLLGGGR